MKRISASKRRAPERQQPEGYTPAPWVQEMHRYFGEKGYYRAEDLQRVLGDPRKSVHVQASSDSLTLSRNLLNKK